MKKIYIIVFIFVSLTVTFFIINRTKQTDIDYLESEFHRWDNEALKDTEIISIMESFMNFLNENPEISVNDIRKLSPLIKVYESDNFRIIEYVENPQFYGSSTKNSYHIVIYDRIVEMLDIDGSTRIEELIKLNDNLYYIYVTDYKFSNITGINIFSIAIDENSIEYTPIISKDEILNGFKFIGSLYYNDGHIHFKDIKNNGSEVFIKINNKIYMLVLKEDGLYHFETLERQGNGREV